MLFVKPVKSDQGKHHNRRVKKPARLVTEKTFIKVWRQPAERLVLVRIHQKIAGYIFPVHDLDAAYQYKKEARYYKFGKVLANELNTGPQRRKVINAPNQRNDNGNYFGRTG